MVGLSALAEVPLASIPSYFTAGMPARGFAFTARARTVELEARARALALGERFRVIGGDEMGCCIDGGSICLAAGESEWVYFDFSARLGDRTLNSITSVTVSPVVTAPDGITATDSEIVDDEYIVDENTVLDADTAIKALITAGSGAGGQQFEVVATVVLSDAAVMKLRGFFTIE